MDEAKNIVGKKVKVQIVRYGNPIGVGKVLDMRNALVGNMRVELEDGTRPMALYPPIEILED